MYETIFLDHLVPGNKLLSGIYLKNISKNLKWIGFQMYGMTYFRWNIDEIKIAFENNTNLFDKYNFSHPIPFPTKLEQPFPFANKGAGGLSYIYFNKLILEFDGKTDKFTEFRLECVDDINDITRRINNRNPFIIYFNDERINGTNQIIFTGGAVGVRYAP